MLQGESVEDKHDFISIVLPTFNEESNIAAIIESIEGVMAPLESVDFEIIAIDNCSEDGTIDALRNIAARDKRLKVILNNRNFGHIRSPVHGILSAYGDAVIYLASDFQDPPELLPEFIKRWRSGSKVVMAARQKIYGVGVGWLRRMFYRTMSAITDFQIVQNATGFGLYDQSVLHQIRKLNDPYPFFRGLVAELGYAIDVVTFEQPSRQSGVSKNNLYSLYDNALLGITTHSVIPLRVISLLGFLMCLVSLFMIPMLVIAKLIWWDFFSPGFVTVALLISLGFSVTTLFIGLLSEYLADVQRRVRNFPIVIEKERLNFDQ